MALLDLKKKKHTTRKNQYMCRMMIISSQWDFSEQIEKLVRLLLCISENCSRKFSKLRVNNAGFYGDELTVLRPTPKLGGSSLAGCLRLLIQ
jgi:hypothetical protein